MTQFSQGTPASTGLPDLYVNVNPPPASVLAGAPSNVLGVVGTATWGPVNSPVVFGDLAGASAAFGYMQARKYDLTTVVAAAVMQGANAFVGVRVTDGTDAAASVAVQTNCITLTAKYTGSRGNSLQAVIAAGTAANSWKITLSLPGVQPEVFDNITGSGAALWTAMANAINNGQSQQRGPSNLVTATAGAGTSAPVAANLTLSGGLDGTTSVTGTTLVGADSSPRTGMYALRNCGVSVLVLADCDASTTWSTQDAFAKSELCEAFCVSPAGDTITNFLSTMNTAGIDSAWTKVILGDWVYFVDGQNNVTRLISPQGFLAGKKVAVGPQNAILNQPLRGVAGTQKTNANQQYSTAELTQLASARGDVIATPSVGGAYFSARTGRNSSSDPGRHDDAYTTLTNFLARSLGQIGGLGTEVGRLITPTQELETQDQIGGFLQNLKDDQVIQGYSVQDNAANNPASQTTLGVENAVALVQYFSVLEYMIVNLTGGQTVVPATALKAAA